MADPVALAERHRIAQVAGATVVQQGLSKVWDQTLNPAALDASFPTYLRASLAVVAAGRTKAASLAKFYYGASRDAVGLEAVIPSIKLPEVDIPSVTTSLLVTGPVSVKKALSTGVGLQAAMNAAKAKTLRAGKRHALDGGREALLAFMDADTDALGFARVSDGQPCAFCAMLVGRGPVYKNKGTASFKSHDGCGCGVRPFFGLEVEGDGFTPDARAFNDLFKASGDLASFRVAYADAVVTPGHPVFSAISDKVGARIATPVIKAAKEEARAAYNAAQDAKRALAEAKAAAEDAAAIAAKEAAAKEAAKEAAKIKKWRGKPQPKKPVAPTPPAKVGPAAFDQWLQEAKDRFAAFAAKTGNPKNDLTQSLNWSYFQRVVNDHDLSALQYLKSNHYIDDAMEAAALQAMKHAEEILPGQAEAYKKALTSFKNRSTRYARYIDEWREVNGITGAQLKGMDDALRHKTDRAGTAWATKTFPVPPDSPGKAAVKQYTGNSYDPWNSALRAHGPDVSTLPKGTWEKATKDADEGGFVPNPEAVIVKRGTSFMELQLDDTGRRAYSIPPPPPEDLIGTVHAQPGYMSTAVGDTSRFTGNLRLHILVPEGHGVAYVDPYSHHPGERELLLQRGSRFYIHDIYEDKYQRGVWNAECEIIPMDADPADYVAATPQPATEKFSAW